MGFEFQWGWCKLCGGSFVYCPKCGNNCCNGGHGKLNGEVCDVCPLTYQYQKLAWETKSDPSKQWIKKHPAKIGKTWFELEAERLRKYDKMSKKEKIKDITNNSKAHKHWKASLIQCCFINDKVDIDLLKAHLEIDPKLAKELLKELKNGNLKNI